MTPPLLLPSCYFVFFVLFVVKSRSEKTTKHTMDTKMKENQDHTLPGNELDTDARRDRWGID